MAIANYVFRRGHNYVWRRLYRGKAIQIPLSTDDPFTAKRLACAASAVSNLGWNLLDAGKAGLSTVRDAITAAVKRERLAVEVEAAGGDPAATPGGSAYFYFFLTDDGPDEEPDKGGCKPERSGRRSKAPPRAEAHHAPKSQTPPKTAPRARAVAASSPARFSPEIPDVVSRMSATHARTGRANAKTLTKMRVIADLFCEITGVRDVRAVRQAHLAEFVATLDRLPPTYRRSAAEREKPIADIIAEAEVSGIKTALSVATVNRNLVHLGKVLKAAQAEGIRVDPSLNPSMLRRFSKRAAKDDREAFTPDDVIRIFAAPVWTGAKSAKQRRSPGAIVVKDWLYWVPLLAAYTGARLEELCGLETADVAEIEGVPVIQIRPNARRGLKNAQSERRIPVHSHLLEVGFLDFVEAQRAAGRADLFHDLRRKSAASQIGDSMAYMWRNIQNDRIGPQDKKTFHSFRHYAVQGLRGTTEVEKHIRAELFGHLVGDIEDDRYGGRAPIGALRAAVEALPRIM